jgi:hypothetical protein
MVYHFPVRALHIQESNFNLKHGEATFFRSQMSIAFHFPEVKMSGFALIKDAGTNKKNFLTDLLT